MDTMAIKISATLKIGRGVYANVKHILNSDHCKGRQEIKTIQPPPYTITPLPRKHV